MKKYPLIIMIIISLISTSIPGLLTEDINSDSCVDLADAVAQMKNLEKNAENLSTISKDFSNTISTLKIVAGIKTQIKKQSETGNTNGQSGLYVLNTKSEVLPLQYFSTIESSDYNYFSIRFSPPLPPPQTNC